MVRRTSPVVRGAQLPEAGSVLAVGLTDVVLGAEHEGAQTARRVKGWEGTGKCLSRLVSCFCKPYAVPPRGDAYKAAYTLCI